MSEQRESIFFVDNKHAARCGDPPRWLRENATGLRFYFQNALGEQWFAEAAAKAFRIVGGDVSWKTKTIEHPDYSELADQLHRGQLALWVMGRDERCWLAAVFASASSAFPRNGDINNE
jgi:hypothetical protein